MNANASHDDNALALDVDHTIDRALSALRDAAPRPGLEGRILASLEHRAITPQSARFHISTHIALWAATSAAVLAIASVFMLHHHAAPTNLARAVTKPVILSGARRAQSKNPGAARRATSSEPFSTTSPARIAPTVSSRPQRAARSREIPVLADAQPNDGATTPTDAQALADLHAPSHPAPPLPLTPQEKLFLRTLRYGNATQLAELSPIVRAKKDADETTDFKAFFPDPPPLHQPGDPE